MREDDGRKLDHQTLEALRLRAVEQVARGVPAAEVGAGLAALGSELPDPEKGRPPLAPRPGTVRRWTASSRARSAGVSTPANSDI